MRQNKNKLIGSASSLEALLKAVTQYFYSDVTFHQTATGQWRIYNNNGEIGGFLVTQNKNRYRFEMEASNETK